jgi:hypothetical protein
MAKKKYNFGFLGLTGSGKTCILAALDMQRRAHPAGYTSALLPVEVAPPTGDKDTWTDAEKKADMLHKSNQRLKEAKQQLEQGTVPTATDLNDDFIFEYEFSSAEMGNFQARLIDYGGELANPEGYAPEKVDLREKLAGMDGLFVLAPAPFPTKKDKAVSEFLNLLQKTLTRIPFNKPIVLLINKWDRVAPLSEYTDSQKPLTPDELPSTEHRDLYNALINKVGEDNCKAFPVSAFGEYERHTTDDGKETEFPKHVNPLASFGLLEGFVWLAQRLNTIKLQTSKARRQLLLSLLFLLVIGLGVKQAYDDNKNYNDIISKLNNPKAEIDDVKKAELWLEDYYYTSPISHPLSWLFVVSNETAKSELDKSRNRREEALWQAIQNAPSLENRLQACKAYLKALPNGVRIGNVKTIIAQLRDTLRKKREQQWWQLVEQAPNESAKLEKARQYLKNMPDGIHKVEAETIIAQIQEALRVEEEQQLWQPVLDATSPRIQIETAQAYLQKKPDGQYAANAKNVIAQAEQVLREAEERRWWLPVEQASALPVKVEKAQAYLEAMQNGKHAADAEIIIAQYESQKEWAAFETEYYDWFTNDEFLKAAQYLSQRQPQDEPKLQALKQQFLANVFKPLEAKINSLIDRRKWSEAYKPLDNYENWPDEFKNGERLGKIEALRRNVQVAEERFFYTQLLVARDLERAENYLSLAPLQTMQDQVTEYKNYLVKMRNPLGLILILERIEWGDFNESSNTITVFMDGKKIIEQAGIDAEANSQTGEIGRSFFRHKLSTLVTIQVKIVEKNWLSGDDDSGQGRKKVNVGKLNGFILDLNGDDFINKAVFRLEGIPQRPNLPSWEE